MGKPEKKIGTLVNWVLWWRTDEYELNRQVEEYNTLKTWQSARGISLLLILFSSSVTFLNVLFLVSNSSAFIDTLAFLVLGLFVYKGHKWAMVVAMLLMTINSLSLFLETQSLVAVFMWAITMHAFYLAFRVELLKSRRVKNGNIQPNSVVAVTESKPSMTIAPTAAVQDIGKSEELAASTKNKTFGNSVANAIMLFVVSTVIFYFLLGDNIYFAAGVSLVIVVMTSRDKKEALRVSKLSNEQRTQEVQWSIARTDESIKKNKKFIKYSLIPLLIVIAVAIFMLS